MHPDTNGEIIFRLHTCRTDDVESQAVLINGIAQVRSIRAVSDTHPAILGGASTPVERLRQRLRCREAQGTNRRLCVRNTEKEVLVVLLIVQAYIRSLVKFGGG
jgi:hypothetical protein